MTETLTGRQVLALLAQDEVPEIECFDDSVCGAFNEAAWSVKSLRLSSMQFRIKPKPPRRLSVTLASGEVVSWPEPVREEPKKGSDIWVLTTDGYAVKVLWGDAIGSDRRFLAHGILHLTGEAAQEHADALRKINTQEATC